MDHNPLDIIKQIQVKKYKTATIPIFLVVLGFVLHAHFKLDAMKYISLFGLLSYIFLIMQFRVIKCVPPKTEKPVILAPIYGKIIGTDKNSITIRKLFFQPADLRAAGLETHCNYSHGITHIFQKNSIPGMLIGIAPGKLLCDCEIPHNFRISVEPGNKVIAGETILAVKDE